MIHCPKCNADNMLGAIFCRTCGEKLNLDDLKPESFQKQKESVGKNAKKVAARVAQILVTLLIVAILALLLLPAPDFSSSYTLSAAELKQVKARVEYLKRKQTRTQQYTFKTAELNVLVNDLLGLKGDEPEAAEPAAGSQPPAAAPQAQAASAPEKAETFEPQYLNVILLQGGFVKLILKSRIYGKLPFYVDVTGRVLVPEDGTGATFQMTAAKAGRMPLFAGLEKLASDRIKNLTDRIEVIGAVAPVVKAVDTDGDSLSVTVGPK